MLKKINFFTNKKERLIFIISICVYLIGMLILSSSTSPIYPYSYGDDSNVFALIGKSITEGKILYKDIFDHKGPLLFFIEAFGYLIGGFTGIFLVQCVLGIIALIFLFATWKILHPSSEKTDTISLVFILLAVYAYFFHTFSRGNFSEELSLPFISICVYLFVKYATNCRVTSYHPPIYAFIYGICFTSLAFIRVNNAISIVAGILCIGIYLIVKRNYKNILINILLGLLGCLAIALPIIIYFASNYALYDMFYATFLYNVKYLGSVDETVFSSILLTIALFLPILFSCSLIVIKLVRTKAISFIDVIAMVLSLVNLICLLLINSYVHYFILFVPIFMLDLSLYWKFPKFTNPKAIIAMACIVFNLLFSAYYFVAIVYQYINNEAQEKYYTVNKTFSVIPENEKNSVIGYNAPSTYYTYGNVLPCHKYFIYQTWWSKNDPSIKKEFSNWIKEERPLWFFLDDDEKTAGVIKLLEENYTLVDKNEYIELYRLKSSQ